MAPGTALLASIFARWPQVRTPEHELDRAALAACIFADADERRALEALVHPEIRRLTADEESRLAADTPVLYVIPLLFEQNRAAEFDRSILVVAPRSQRLRRVMARDGLAATAVEVRMAAQIDPTEAIRRADEVIFNDGDRAALRRQVLALWQRVSTETRHRSAE